MPSSTDQGRPAGGLAALGIIGGIAPAILFVASAFSGLGPRTAVLVSAAPVLIATAVTIWVGLRLQRSGRKAAARWVAGIAIVVGVPAYVAWIYLASLGIQFGDGPL